MEKRHEGVWHDGWTHTYRDLQKCCERETGQRRYVYPRRVADEKMTQAKADREIAMMVAMAEHFRQLADTEEEKGRLI